MDNFIASQYWYATPGSVPMMSFPRDSATAALIPYMPAGQQYPLRFPYEMPQSWLPVQDQSQMFLAYPQQLVYYCEQPAQLAQLAAPSPVYFWNGQLITFQ